jgi:8-oxo-dGTP diphosphatase
MRKVAQYTLGFVFNHRIGHGGVHAPPTQVLLIQKAKPAWQAGRMNGLGGKLEKGESFAQCGAREVEEESRRPGAAAGERGAIDVAPEEWRHFGVLRGAEVYHHEASASFEIHLFSAFVPFEKMIAAEAATCLAVEPLRLLSLDALFLGEKLRVLPNVRWMVCMALSFQQGEVAQAFEVRELTLEQLMGEAAARAAEAP